MKERLKELRKKLNLTQSEFGKSIKLSKSSISNIENGTINLTDRNILEICERHNVNENWLRNGVGEMFLEMNADEELAYFMGMFLAEHEDKDSEKKNFLKALLQLDDEDDWKMILNLVEGLVKKNKKSKEN